MDKSAGTSNKLAQRYLAALRTHLDSGPRASLQPARALGRRAQSSGLELLDLARVHERALVTLAAPRSLSGNGDRFFARAAEFFIEALAPIEHTPRAAREISGRVDRLNATMRRQTSKLAATSLQLEREIDRRKTVELALKKTAKHYDELLGTSRHMQDDLRRLSHEILWAHEEERKAISRELHDEIGQSLTAINVMLATLTKEATVNTKGLKKKVASTQRLVEKSMKTVHRFARELRPPLLDDLGLVPALHSYMKLFTKRTRIVIRFAAFTGIERLNNETRTVLFRVAQEALTNVNKHAQASLVRVGVKKLPGAVCMEIHDNGRSFRVRPAMRVTRIKRLGLIGMRERVEMVGGSFTVESEPGEGTTIRVRIPVA